MLWPTDQFKIEDTWNEQPSNPQNKKSSQEQRDRNKKSNQSPLINAGKQVVPQPTHHILDNKVAQNILRDIHQDFGIQQYDKKSSVERLLNQNKVPDHKVQKPPTNSTNNNDLIASMAQRLKQLEGLVNSYRNEIREKTSNIQKLEADISVYKQGSGSEQTEKLMKENLQLKQQLKELNAFLLQYGLKMKDDVIDVKDKANKDKMEQLKQVMNQPKPLYNYHLPNEINIEILRLRVDELNTIVEKEGNANQVYKASDGTHRIQKMNPIPIGFFKNGLVLKGYPFYSYGSNDGQQILADLLEGYFPYQLKKLYPNGALIKVIDKTDENYDSEKYMNAKYMDLNSVDEMQLKPMSKDQFLEQLPEKVIKNGKIYDIRGEIAKKFKDNTPASLPNQNIKNDIDPESPDACQIIVNSEDKQLTFYIHKDKDISELIKECERSLKTVNVRLLLNFPRTIFDQNSSGSLEENGLHPNAQLYVMKNNVN